MPTNPGDPFFFPGGSSLGCLLLHGFGASPREMRYLGERLAAAGFTVLGVRVAGHGTDVDDFAHTTRQEWLASTECGLAELRTKTDRVVVVGQSMGALLALQLAARHTENVPALALLAPALRLARPWIEYARPLFALLARGDVRLRKNGSDIADSVARAERVAYPATPMAALNQLLLLQRATRRVLSQVTQPILTIQSRQDHTCSPQGIAMLKQRVRGPVEEIWLNDSFHVVSLDVDKDRVADAVVGFAGRFRDSECVSV